MVWSMPVTAAKAALRRVGWNVDYRVLLAAVQDGSLPAEWSGNRWSIRGSDLPFIAETLKARHIGAPVEKKKKAPPVPAPLPVPDKIFPNVVDWGKVTMRVRPDAEATINDVCSLYATDQSAAHGRTIRRRATKQDFMHWCLELGLAELGLGPDVRGRYRRRSDA